MEIIPLLFNNSFDFQVQLLFLQDNWFQIIQAAENFILTKKPYQLFWFSLVPLQPLAEAEGKHHWVHQNWNDPEVLIEIFTKRETECVTNNY